jgi:agmatinase
VTQPPAGPPDGRTVPRFAGPDTFARLPRLLDVGAADVALLGIPFDSGVSYRPGARFGPAAVRAGSKLLRPYNPALDVQPWVSRMPGSASPPCPRRRWPSAVWTRRWTGSGSGSAAGRCT